MSITFECVKPTVYMGRRVLPGKGPKSLLTLPDEKKAASLTDNPCWERVGETAGGRKGKKGAAAPAGDIG